MSHNLVRKSMVFTISGNAIYKDNFTELATNKKEIHEIQQKIDVIQMDIMNIKEVLTQLIQAQIQAEIQAQSNIIFDSLLSLLQ